ncbi:hypothetical protein ABPG72_005909 [Tetrahymena utriculariae]
MISSNTQKKLIQNSFQNSFRNISNFPNYISYAYIQKIINLDIDLMIIKYAQHIIRQIKENQNSSSEETQEIQEMNKDWQTNIFFNSYASTLERMNNKYESYEQISEFIKQQKNEYKKLNFDDSNKYYKYLYLLQNNNIKPFTDQQNKRFNLEKVLQKLQVITVNG